jgi:hypothetical protein
MRNGMILDPDCFRSSPVDGEAAASAAGPATGERPAPTPPNPADAGHPNFVDGQPFVEAAHPRANFDRPLSAAAYGLREWAEHRDCEAPMYWRAIADSLEAVR